uniref:CCHC-type domain-containing protein n=1 Tax=Trichogramma kaykai TaxID=54128 RepID=A0ABD2W4Y3_9HYME
MDLDDAIMKAVDVERYSQIRQATGSNLTTMGLFNIPATTASSHYDARTKQEVAPPTLPLPKSDSTAESSGKAAKKVKCQICRMDGHEANTCFKLQRLLPVCTSCLEEGHEGKQCSKNRNSSGEQGDSGKSKGNHKNFKKFNKNNKSDKSNKENDAGENQQPKNVEKN